MDTDYRQAAWDLSDLYESLDSQALKDSLKKLEDNVSAFEKMRGHLGPDMDLDVFSDMVSRMEDLTRTANRVHAYVGLRFAENTQDQKVQAFMAQVQQTMAALANRTLFFEIWWKKLDDADAGRFIAVAGDRAYWLEEMRHFKPHTLTEPEEKIINIKDVTGIAALTTLYDSLTSRYVYKMEIDGEIKSLTRGEIMVYARSHDPRLREAAYRELYRVYGHDGPILGQMYQTLVRDWYNENVDLRKHASPVSVRNLSNDLPDGVVDTLLDVCRENAPLFQRFFKLKAKILGVGRLRRYDLYAPVSRAEKHYDFGDAVHMVMTAFEGFDRSFADSARKVFKDRHVDSEVRPGKRDGAFCASVVPEMTPYVLLSYQGKPGDVATLAHELGHAVHSVLASDHGVFTFEASLPLAENASTFGEMLLLDHLLGHEKDESVRKDLLFRQMDDAYATIMRQSYFALFEKQAHAMVRDGATVDEIADAYMENIRDQFGDSVELSDEFRWEWVSIPHFYHTPFYVYAYSFGQLLVFSLYRQYKADPQGFTPRYLDILSAGGSKSPSDILAGAGLDIASADFWRGGFDVVRDLLDELERIA